MIRNKIGLLYMKNIGQNNFILNTLEVVKTVTVDLKFTLLHQRQDLLLILLIPLENKNKGDL